VLTVAGGYAFGIYGVFAALLTASIIQLLLFHHGLAERFERRFDLALLGPLLVDGMPMLAGAVAFETIRNADRIVIGSVLGFTALGVYSVTQIVCQGIYYLPNALSTVMFPRFQARYGETLAAISVLLVALPPAIRAFLPAFADTIPPLRVMLVGTYFLCLSPPAGQFLLTVRKQTPALFVALPATAVALGGAYLGAASGLVGVAAGVASACFVEFVGINVYALSHFADARSIAGQVLGIAATAALWIAATLLIERIVPEGPGVTSVIGGWRLLAVGLLAVPLLARAARRIRALQTPGPIDNLRAGH
jgi:O-antigen/teichoic acid export membrane protein